MPRAKDCPWRRDIIDVTQDVEGLTHRPRTAETREVYLLILSAIHTTLGDQPQEVIRSTADTVLDLLKDEGRKDFDQKHIEGVLGPFTSEQFAQLVNLSKKITDYSTDDEIKTDPDNKRKEAKIDEEGGVTVVINEEEQEDEEEEDYEIGDESDEKTTGMSRKT